MTQSSRRPDLRGWALAVVAVLLALAAMEGAAAAWGAYRRSQVASRPDLPLFIVRDATLGWRAAPDRRLTLDAAGARFTTGPRGWRRYEAAPSRPLLLVFGDSYTHAVGVADGAVYYDVVARRLGLAVAAFGVNGYGTVQELMVAREGAPDLPGPAAILLQLADNDPINNSLALERRSFVNNNLLPRPYLDEAGAVAMADPRRLHERLVLGRELSRRLLAGRLSTVESAIDAGDPGALALYGRELGHTARALALLRGTFPDCPALAFNVGGSGGRIGRDLERLAREAGFAYLDLGPRFRDATALREIVQADGAHWNATGHALAGRALAEALAPQLAAAGVAAAPISPPSTAPR